MGAKGCKYKFSNEEIKAIEEARKANKNKRVEARLKALELRAKGASLVEAAQGSGFSITGVSHLIGKYRDNGLEAIVGNNYHGNRRNMSVEKEVEILSSFAEKAEKGQIVDVKDIAAAYQAEVDHKVSDTQIYYVLKRHGWQKVMPRGKHPKSADPEAVEASKKLTVE